jgi:hypothetical protein
MSIKNILMSKYFKVAAVISGVILVALVSFGVGVKVGFRKALFSTRWGQNYEQNFFSGSREKGAHPLFMGKMDSRGMRNGHGIAGEILSVSGDTLVIKDRNSQENTVRLNGGTIINRGRETVEAGSLTVGEKVAVIGKPQEDGVIAAHLIRIFVINEK